MRRLKTKKLLEKILWSFNMDNKKYEVGQIHEGMVTGIQPYGAFISFPNGNHGLVHISEISSLSSLHCYAPPDAIF